MLTKVQYKDILKFHFEILKLIGLDDFSIQSVSKGLCDASLRGVDSHGIRLLPHYVDSALMGRKNPKPNFVFKKNFPSVGVLDADNAFGHAAGMKAIKYGIEIANEMGMGAVAVKNSSHPGALASIALIAAKKGILLRQMDVYSIKNSLRVTIGNNKENLKLMSELKKILNA